MKKLKYIFLSLTLVILFTRCSKNFFDINEDPRKPKTATSKLILPSAIASSAYTIGGYYEVLGEFWTQHWAQSTGATQWTAFEDYSLTTSDFEPQWENLYSGVLYDCEYLRNQTLASKDWTYYLAATAIQSYTYQMLADLYDQIPFTEALKGIDVMTPKFDDGQTVYDSLIARLDFALSKDFTVRSGNNPDATSSEIGTEDLIFGGNIDNWIQFVNTLKLKMYLRQTKVRPQVAQAGIQALLQENNFLNVNAAMTAFKNEEDNRNPVYETFIDRLAGNLVANTTLVNTLKDADDTLRLFALFKTPENGGSDIVALTTGHYKLDASVYQNYKDLSVPNFGPLQPVYFFTVSEVNFMLAEANLRYGDAASVQGYYNAGIDASFQELGLTADPALYGAGGKYEYPATGTFDEQLRAIMLQKWIASTNSRAIESFFDQNRTGYPDNLVISPTNSTNNQMPKRLLFPYSELTSNPNTPQQVPIYTPVWWAK